MSSPDHAFTVATPNGPIAGAFWDGDGSPALLIHGVNGSTSSWGQVAELVAGRRRLAAVDLRGRGLSPSTGPWGVAAHAQDVAAVLSHLVEEAGGPITLVGHSFGGHVAACAALLAADRVADLVLVDGGPPRRIPAGSTADEIIDGALANIVPHLDGLPFPVSAEAVTADFRSMVVDDEATTSLAATVQPLHLIRAGHGVAPGLPPIIDDETLAELLAGLVAERPVTSELVGDATHFSLLGDHAGVVADAVTGPPN